MIQWLRRKWRAFRWWLIYPKGRHLKTSITFETSEELREIYGLNDESLVDRMAQAIREEMDESALNAAYFGQAWRESMPNYHGRLQGI